MKCEKCGKQIDYNSIFCKFCGNTQGAVMQEYVSFLFSILKRETDKFLKEFDIKTDSLDYTQKEIPILGTSLLLMSENIEIRKQLIRCLGLYMTNSKTEYDDKNLKDIIYSITCNTGGMCESDTSTESFKSWLDSCKNVHLIEKSDTDSNVILLDFETGDVYKDSILYKPIIIDKALANCSFEELFNQRNSIYVNYYKHTGYQDQGYFEQKNAEMEENIDLLEDYINERISFYNEMISHYFVNHNILTKISLYRAVCEINGMLTYDFPYDDMEQLSLIYSDIQEYKNKYDTI